MGIAETLKEQLRLSVLENPYIPWTPTEKQVLFLSAPNLEVLYGGAAGGGKSAALLMGALQYVDIPGYSAILLRRSYADLSLPGALMSMAFEWLGGTLARWDDRSKTWTFPASSTLTFGYLAETLDHLRYQSSAYQYIGFDESSQFENTQYLYLFSRLRRPEGSKIPLRMRSASNPGGPGHEWVRQRFLIEGEKEGRLFIPARLEDNPHLDREQYEQSLLRLDPITRAQLRYGDWSIIATEQSKFRREWFEVVDEVPEDLSKIRFWDLAATTPKPGRDPDWTAGAFMGEAGGVFYILDIHRTRERPKAVEDLIKRTAETDGKEVLIYMEQEPGASGVALIDHYAREVLKGFAFYGQRSTGAKEIRANPLSAAAENGNVKLLRGTWINDFLDEAEMFGIGGKHDDQVDAASGAFGILAENAGGYEPSVQTGSMWDYEMDEPADLF